MAGTPAREPKHGCGVQICEAQPADAAAIFAVKQQAFAARYLGYTIYQAPQSVSFIEELILKRPPGQRFTVLKRGSTVIGYYHAVRLADELLLNYIAVATSEQGNRYGDLLLRDFEEYAGEVDCRSLLLDVFASSPTVVDWYGRRGFCYEGEKYLSRLSISRLDDSTADLLIVEDALLADALAEECLRGFSRVSGSFGHAAHITVGLIDRHVCKLLAFDGTSQEQAAHCLGRTFRRSRDVLVVTSAAPLSPEWPVLTSEKSLRLSKSLSVL